MVRMFWACAEEGRDVVELYSTSKELEKSQPENLSIAQWYIDDSRCAFSSRNYSNPIKSKWLVLSVLLPRLYCVTGPEFDSALADCVERDDVLLYAEKPLGDTFGTYVTEKLNTPIFELWNLDSRSEDWPPEVKRVLAWLMIVERLTMAPAVGLTAVPSPIGSEIYVTAGWQMGLNSSVEGYRLYWSRVLEWCRNQYEQDGLKCAIDLGYVNQLCRVSSLAGFVLALGTPQCSKADERLP